MLRVLDGSTLVDYDQTADEVAALLASRGVLTQMREVPGCQANILRRVDAPDAPKLPRIRR
jgi:hypothetical protein